MKYTDEQVRAFFHAIRSQGWAVCAWTPKELRGADADSVEERLCEFGSAVIEMHADEEFDADAAE